MKAYFILMFLVASLFFQLILHTPSSGANGEPIRAGVEQPDMAVQQKKHDSSVLPVDTTVATSSGKVIRTQETFLLRWLHMLDHHERSGIKNSNVMAFAPRVPGDLARIFVFTGEQGTIGFFAIFWRMVAPIGLGLLVVLGIRRIAHKSVVRFEKIMPPVKNARACLWTGMLRNIPALAGLVLFTLVAIVVFLSLAGDTSAGVRMMFQTVLGTVLMSITCVIVGRIIFAPQESVLRPFALKDMHAGQLYRAFVTSAIVLFSGILFIFLIRELGALPQTVAWVAIILGSAVISVFAWLVVYLRQPVSASIHAKNNSENDHWFTGQLADYWHVGALLYLLVVWFIFIGRELTGTMTNNGSFIISLLIVPIYLVLSRMGEIIITAIVESLGLGTQQPSKNWEPSEETVDEKTITEQKKTIVAMAGNIFRLILVVSLATWLFSLWDHQIPYASQVVGAIFESLVTLGLALLTWRFVSSYIAVKLHETIPDSDKKEEDIDGELGGATPRSRSLTLLPMLRKVIGSILIVMVVLIVLSSLGVNIGPLLAGAGVIGLAVGFGAHKLVSDILSGFFFLLDDAFRVGEYIQTGSISGTVESITLRNVILRHHLGMLQVVPHSDLGAVTNFMRGGMVIKFPLELPYDTDIDKVRKIIKNVGNEMLKDEEMADAFLKPLKSQGVHSISNSVMVIRVKFTAKPGKQFIIKREAFRRITKALNERGIYYAHRKVIVDFPDSGEMSTADREKKERTFQAGGAAAAVLAAGEEQKKKEDEK